MPPSSIIRDEQSVVKQEVEQSEGASIQILLGPEDEMPNFYARHFTILPGGSIPEHRHQSIEHEQYVIEGEMILSLSGEERLVGAGTAVYIPPMVWHRYENRGSVPVRFICIVPRTRDYETEWKEPAA